MAAAAYNTRARLKDQLTGKTHRYTRKQSDIVLSGILAREGAPAWATDREAFWNRVEAAENRKDARVAKTIEVALPRGVAKAHWQSLIEEFVAPYVAKGLVVDYSIHDNGTGHNPHCHILLPTRPLSGDGFTSHKLTELNAKRFIYDVREAWATVCNKFLKAAGSSVRLDHRSLKARGIARPPTRHRGKQPRIQEPQPQVLRQEQSDMAKRPTFYDKRDYPLLTEREDWPPQFRTPSQDMSEEERAELAEYWQKQDQDRDHQQDAEHEQVWGEPAENDHQQQLDEQEILERKARSLPMSREEQMWLDDVQRDEPEKLELTEQQIIQERVSEIKAQEQKIDPADLDAQYHETMQKQRDRVLNYTASERQRIAEARLHSDAAENRVRDEILQERIDAHHHRLEQMPQ